MSHLLNRPESAERLRVHPGTFLTLIKARRVSAIEVGRKWRFSEEDIQEYLAQSTQPMDGMCRTLRSQAYHDKHKAGA